MIDSNAAFRSWLIQSPDVVGVGDRIFCPMLPETYDVDQDGPAVSFSTRGGLAEREVPLISPSIQVVTWAPAGDHVQARRIYGAIFDCIHGKCAVDLGAAGFVLSCLEEVQGQDVTDPDTGWATVTSYFKLTMRA